MIEWPKDIISTIARRRCVLFLGSGISANSKNESGKSPCTWEQFLVKILDEKKTRIGSSSDVIKDLLSNKDYLTACEIIVDCIGEESFSECAADEYRRPGYSTNKVHEAIYALDSKIVLTPNIDKLYEQYAMTESNSTIVVKSYFEEDIAKYLRTEDYLIIRIHGGVDDTKKYIFTHKQYARARSCYTSFYKLLDALILTHTFIFLGCGINDPDIQLLLENANFVYPGCRPHYLVCAKESFPPEIGRSLLQNRNIECLTYSNADGSHQKLLDSLNELVKLVDDKRAELGETCNW